jgi:alkyl hydroperoxide reductase subunit AhpF
MLSAANAAMATGAQARNFREIFTAQFHTKECAFCDECIDKK